MHQVEQRIFIAEEKNLSFIVLRINQSLKHVFIVKKKCIERSFFFFVQSQMNLIKKSIDADVIFADKLTRNDFATRFMEISELTECYIA